jgi:hypothetical protein
MAKLCASLLEKHDLPLTAVLSHKETSQIGYYWKPQLATYIKCCPKTIRHATLYDNTAKKMIEYELLYLQKIEKEGYKAEFQIDPDSAEYIDKDGRVIKLPSVQRMVSYTIKLTDPDNTSQEKRYYSQLPSTETDYIDRCDLNGCVTNNITSFASFFSTDLFRGIFESPEDQSCICSDQRGIIVANEK